MRIESIKIQNLRQLKNLSLEFGRNTSKNDLHVILAENGVGKTNIVNALTWCLYNKETHLRDEQTALPIVNNQTINDVRQRGGGVEEVSVSLMIDTDDETDWIEFKRVGKYNITKDAIIPISDNLQITIQEDGGHRIIDNPDETAQIVHKYLPEEINNYIFFDGEQLETFFSRDQIEKVRLGINQLTQASYLNKVAEFLDKYVKTDITPRYKEANDKELDKQQNKVEEKQKIIDGINQTIDEHNGQLEKCTNQINDLNIKIRGFENLKDKIEELKKREKEVSELQNNDKEKLKELMKFTKEYYTLLSYYPSLHNFHEYIMEQDAEGNLPPKVDKGILIKMLQSKHCPICNSDNLDENHMNHVNDLIRTLSIASATSGELNRAIGYLATYKDKVLKYDKMKDRITRERKKIQVDLRNAEQQLEILTNYLKTIPNEDEIVRAITMREDFISLRDELLMKIGNEKATKEIAKSQYEEEKKILDTLVNKHKELEKYERQKDFCEKCSQIMNVCKDEILEECRSKIQEETFSIFNDLIWKKGHFSGIKIHDNYAFELLDRFNNQCLGSCSAAETALLALSFTLALQDVSKHDALLFIDTPIGRVGTENRTNFMEILMNISKDKQVILTFTPTEYDTNVQEILSTNYSTFSKLDMDSVGQTIKR